jgi:hypothetical protein
MKGIIADCKTGRIELIEDGLPDRELAPMPERESLDIIQANQAIRKINDMAPGTITAAPLGGAFASKATRPGALARIKSSLAGLIK